VADRTRIRLHLLCRLRRDKPTAFWATRRKASLSDSEGNHPKAQEVRCKKKHILPPQAATSSGFICFADYAATSKCNGVIAE